MTLFHFLFPRRALHVFAGAWNALASSVVLGQGTTKEPAKPLPFLSPIFGDNMVLQRGKVNTIWGWSEPGDKVRVQIAAKSASGVEGPDRRWVVKIQPPHSGGPYTVSINGREVRELHNVLVTRKETRG